MKKHSLPVMILLALSILLTSCKGNSGASDAPSGDGASVVAVNADPQKNSAITLNYSPDESLNPYKTKSETNLLLASLMFGSLVSVSDRFEPVLLYAEKISFKNKVFTVEIRKDILFSDGTPFTADDALYSLNTAKASSSIYKDRLANVSTAAVDGESLTVTLRSSDPYFAACLDFPIVKKNTGNDKLPTGSGIYILDGDKLVCNQKSAIVPEIKEIALIEMPDYETTLRSVEIGTINLFYTDFTKGDIAGLNGTYAAVPINHFIYIGTNSNDSRLTPEIRQAISLALDRESVVAKAFYGRAKATSGIFNPEFFGIDGIKQESTVKETDRAVKLIEDEKFTQKNSKGIRRTKNGTLLSFTLLINEADESKERAALQIQASLKLAGIGISIIKKPFADYEKALQEGSFELYLSEVRLSNNQNLSSLLTKNASLSYGISEENPSIGAYRELLDGACDFNAFYETFNKDMPVIPLCYREGIVALSRNISGAFPNATSIFAGIEKWSVS